MAKNKVNANDKSNAKNAANVISEAQEINKNRRKNVGSLEKPFLTSL